MLQNKFEMTPFHSVKKTKGIEKHAPVIIGSVNLDSIHRIKVTWPELLFSILIFL